MAANEAAPGTSRGPVSVNIPKSLRSAVAREARRRGLALSTTLRALVVERMREIAEEEELSHAEIWQRAQAWATWDRIRRGDRREVSRAELHAVFDRASAKRKKK
jgi:hypothetical protein